MINSSSFFYINDRQIYSIQLSDLTRQANARLSTSLLYLKQQTDFSLNKDIFCHTMPRRYWIVTFKESNISQFVLTETNCDHFTLNFLSQRL